MHEFYELKEMLMDEVKKIANKGELTAGSLETVDKLLNSIKNACKIIMYDEYEKEGYSQADADMSMNSYAYARGRGRNAQRDSMGRYSSEGGYSNDGNYSNARGGYSRRYGYAYADKGEKVAMLREMMQEVSTDEERRALQKLIRKMENE